MSSPCLKGEEDTSNNADPTTSNLPENRGSHDAIRHFLGLGILAKMPHAAFEAPIRDEDLGEVVPLRSGSREAVAGVVCLPRPCSHRRYTMVFGRLSRAYARSHATAGTPLGGPAMSTPVSLPALLESFFTQRLMQQRQASPHTISSYRDTFRQFLKFAEQRLHKPPSLLNFQ